MQLTWDFPSLAWTRNAKEHHEILSWAPGTQSYFGDCYKKKKRTKEKEEGRRIFFTLRQCPLSSSSSFAKRHEHFPCRHPLGATNTSGSTAHYCPSVRRAMHSLRPNVICSPHVVTAASKVPWPTIVGLGLVPEAPAASLPGVSFGSL